VGGPRRPPVLSAAHALSAGEHGAAPAPSLGRQTGHLILGGLLYGAVMGSFGGLLGERVLQILFSALKVPLLLLATFGLSLPSFYVLNSLVGLRRDFPRVLRALLATQAAVTLILASLAPLTAVWYLSSTDYRAALVWNGGAFAVASLGGQLLLRRHYAELTRRDPRHRWMLHTWVALYSFVGIQMAWTLRPFVGSAEMPIEFLREDSWGNAYVVVLRLVLGPGSAPGP
jgi:hypothetical protein